MCLLLWKLCDYCNLHRTFVHHKSYFFHVFCEKPRRGQKTPCPLADPGLNLWSSEAHLIGNMFCRLIPSTQTPQGQSSYPMLFFFSRDQPNFVVRVGVIDNVTKRYTKTAKWWFIRDKLGEFSAGILIHLILYVFFPTFMKLLFFIHPITLIVDCI